MKEPHSLPPPPPNQHSLSPPAPLFQQKRLAEGVSVAWAYGKLEDPLHLSSVLPRAVLHTGGHRGVFVKYKVVRGLV